MGQSSSTADRNGAAAVALSIPELLLAILASLDQTSLARACLVNRVFHQVGQVVLYRSPEITAPRRLGPSEPNRGQRLLESLGARADLRELVERVALSTQAVHNTNPKNPKQPPTFLAVKLHVGWHALRLPRLVDVQLYHVSATNASEWLQMISTVSPAVERLSLDGTTYAGSYDQLAFNSVGPNLAAFAALKELNLSAVNFASHAYLDLPPPTFHLERLKVDYASRTQPLTVEALRWLCTTSAATLTHVHLTRCDLLMLNYICESFPSLTHFTASLTIILQPVEFLAKLIEIAQREGVQEVVLSCWRPQLDERTWGTFRREREALHVKRGYEVIVYNFR